MEVSVCVLGKDLFELKIVVILIKCVLDWKELFQGIYFCCMLLIWVMWFMSYMVVNGMIIWFLIFYCQVFNLLFQISIFYGFLILIIGVVVVVICVFFIDKVGCKWWYIGVLFVVLFLLVVFLWLGVMLVEQVLVFVSFVYVIVQIVIFLFYFYFVEIYLMCLWVFGIGVGSVWFRFGFLVGLMFVGFIMLVMGIQYVFVIFVVILLICVFLMVFFVVEIKGRVLEEFLL